MLLDQGQLNFLNKIVQDFHRGIFCPAIMWELLASRLSEESAVLYLNAINKENQKVLRNSYLERPWSLNGSSFEDQKALRLLIETWCQQSASLPDY